MADITVIGTGYVGLVTGACLSDFGNRVVCADTDERKIAALKAGEIPLYEPGVEELVRKNVTGGRLSFSTDIKAAINQNEVVYIAVGTPSAEDGSADLSHVEAVARQIGRVMDGYRIIVDKSTVPVGTGRKVMRWIREELNSRGVEIAFDVVSNPEFLREGSAVYDFMHPDRIVIGADGDGPIETMKSIYRSLILNNAPFVTTNIETAEMVKYASNAFLAVKIGFINEIANLCEAVGANALDVARAMGRDGRIGSKFLHPGPGYGGSCFPKDTRALADIGRRTGNPMLIVDSTIRSNERQMSRMIAKIEAAMGDLRGKRIAVLGLSFKPNTDDVREAPALAIIEGLLAKGARISAYDPAAMEEARKRLAGIGEDISYCPGEYESVKDADAMAVITEWNQFRNLDLGKIKALMKGDCLFDFRNIYEKDEATAKGFKYFGVGR